MATFEITAPNGKTYRIEGENREGALAALKIHLGEEGSPQPPKPVGQTAGIAANVTQGALFGAGDEYMAGLSAVLGVQPDGQGGADWFQYDKPLRERYGVALDAIRGEMGEYRENNPGRALAANIAGGVGGAVGVAAAAPASILPRAATTTLGRVGQVSAGGAVGGAVEGFNSGEGGPVNRAKSSAVGAGIGAVFAPVVGFGMARVLKEVDKIGGAALRRVFQSRQLFDRETGALTDRGVERLQALGFDPEGLSAQLQKSFGVAAERATAQGGDAATGAAIGRTAVADRFGVPLTRGQATGDVAQVAAEENFRAGTRGQGAYDTIQGFDRMQSAAVDQARDSIVPGSPTNRIDAADAVMTGVRREAEAARVAGGQAYDALDASGAAIGGDVFPRLRDEITNAVRAEGFPIDAGTPNAQAALNLLETTFANAKTGSVPFVAIERARQRMLGLSAAAARGSNGPDQVATQATVREFDRWLDDTITDALTQGDAAVLDQAKNARALWSRYRQTFLGKDGADNYIRKIVEDDLAPDQVAGWIYGASQNIGGGASSKIASRLKGILGEESPEWQSVRRAAWDRITQNTEGRDARGPQAMASSISELLDGKGQTLGRELFTDYERQVMAEFRDMLKVLVPPPKATNPSGSGYEVQRAMGVINQAIGGLIGAGAGGPVGAAVGRQAVQTGGSFSATLQARAAARGLRVGGSSVPAAIGGGVAAGAAAQDGTFRD